MKEMTEIQTDRLTLKTNCSVIDGQLVFPKKPITISLLDIKPAQAEDGGFAIYLKNGERIGHIGILFKRKPYELSVGIDERYRKCGYMTEAQGAAIQWLFENCHTNQITALIGPITPDASYKLCKRYGFHQVAEADGDWWVLDKADFKR